MLFGLSIGFTAIVVSVAAVGSAPMRPCDAAPRAAVQTARDTESVLRVEQAWIEAIEDRDTSAVACILADDFLDTSWQGVLRTKRDQIDGLDRPRAYTSHYSEWRVRVYGSVAIARGLNVLTDTSGHDIGKIRFTDVFAYRDGRWQAVAAQETAVAASRALSAPVPPARS